MLPCEDLMTRLHDRVITEESGRQPLGLYFDKLSESLRSNVKRSKERCLEEGVQLLRQIPEAQLRGLEELLARLLLSMQVRMVSISTACRKVDQMLQHLAKVDHHLVFRETRQFLISILNTDQLCYEDLQKACMFLEDSAAGREVWRESLLPWMSKVSDLFPVLLRQESLRDGPLCYIAVKVCLQMFQLLSSEVAPLVWDGQHPAVQQLLQALMDIILGQCSNRDTRLLAGAAVAMLINTASESGAAGAAARSLLQVSQAESWTLTVGALRAQCPPEGRDGVDRLAVSRGLLSCCPPPVLLTSYSPQACLLLKGLFPMVYALCEEKLDCQYFAFEVLTLWLKKVRVCLGDLWKATGARLLPPDSRLQQQLIHILWTNAESPVDGVSALVRSAFSLLLDLYGMDCEHCGDTERPLYSALLERTIKLPWEAKARSHLLCALLPYVGAARVLEEFADISDHLLKCCSTNHLSPCASELYQCLTQQQRRELCGGTGQPASHAEWQLAGRWARRWRPVLLEALTSEATLLQSNASTHLLPCTFRVFPGAVGHLLASLDPAAPGHLHAWACILSSYRAVTGVSPWAVQGGPARETLQLALGSADDRVRLAALSLLCCSAKPRDAPTAEDVSIMRTFIPQNLNCESSSFRQRFQAGVRRFLVRVRDSCLVHVRGKGAKKEGDAGNSQRTQDTLEQGVGFVEWLSRLPYSCLAPGHSYQRKKTALLLLYAVLETCTDTWSPDKKKGQPPANMGSLTNYARQTGQWDFFCRTKQLVLISCLEDSTNEIRELSAGLLLRFFPSFPGDISAVLFTRAKQLLCSPRVQEAQMGALMMKVLRHKSRDWPEVGVSGGGNAEPPCMVRFLVKELEEHYLTAKADMMLAARTKPAHGVLSALQRCVLDEPSSACDTLDHSLIRQMLDLLERLALLLLAVLRGAPERDAPPSFCDMGNAISSLIAQAPGGGHGDGEERVLLSEEHSLVLTCCWVSLKEIGIFLGLLVEKMIAVSDMRGCLLTKDDVNRASKVFKNILLKCRHWGAVEGCCTGFTKFCASLLSSSDSELREIPAHMLKQGLQVVQSPSSTSVTRRAAGLPMLILCVVSAEEASKARPLLAESVHTLLGTAQSPLPESWDQTLDLPQVCAVHTLQALVRGSGLGLAVLQFAPTVTILSLTLLRSPCWAMRNAALQLYSALCSRMLGQRPSSEEGGPAQHGMSPSAFFFHYPTLQPFLLDELRGAAQDLQGSPNDAKLHLQPSLHPVLTLLAQLQPGVQDSTETLSDFLPPLLQLSASPIYSVRVMASKALVAMAPPSEYMNILIKLTAQLPGPRQCCSHNRLHGQLLQIRAILDRALCTHSVPAADMSTVLNRVTASLWLATEAQRCPLVRAAYLSVAESLRGFCSETYISNLSDTLMHDLQKPQEGLQVGLPSFHQQAIYFLCADSKWACQLWGNFSAASPDIRLASLTWVADGWASQQTSLQEVIQRVLQSNLMEALSSHSEAYRSSYLTALAAVMAGADPASPTLEETLQPECLDSLLGSLEEQRGGPEILSRGLRAASVLLPRCSDSSRLQTSWSRRLCGILESLRTPEAPEVLRMACADALCAAGVPLLERRVPSAVAIRLIDTGLHLLQDQSPQVRLRAAAFSSALHQVRRGEAGGRLPSVQVNQAVPLLLELLLQEGRDAAGTLPLLLRHLPPPDLRPVLGEALDSGCPGLYEQDEANVFAEPSVMCAHVLPRLLRLAGERRRSPRLARDLSAWAEQNAAQLLDAVGFCTELLPGEAVTPTWLALLRTPAFHGSLCGLLGRAALLLRLLRTSERVGGLCDPAALHVALQRVHGALARSGVHFPPAITAAVAGELPA